MKKNRSCPKCLKNNIIGGFAQEEKNGTNIDIGGEFLHHKISNEIFICLDCGYLENYVNNKDLIKIKEYLRLKGDLS